ncbi:EamA family transporter, partial [Bacillus thuringiensis]
KGLELMDASIGSLFFFFQPIVGSLLGWLLLNETLNSNFFIGGILIICSVFITTFEKK